MVKVMVTLVGVLPLTLSVLSLTSNVILVWICFVLPKLYDSESALDMSQFCLNTFLLSPVSVSILKRRDWKEKLEHILELEERLIHMHMLLYSWN